MHVLLAIVTFASAIHARRVQNPMQPTAGSANRPLASFALALQPSRASTHPRTRRTLASKATNVFALEQDNAKKQRVDMRSRDLQDLATQRRNAHGDRLSSAIMTDSGNRLHRSLEVLCHFASRRAALFGMSTAFLTRAQAARSAEPSDEAVLVAKRAFRAFDQRDLLLADDLFTQTINEWRRLDRSVDEITSLLVARAGVRTDRKLFTEAKADLDEAIALMAPTGETTPGGRARYKEYPDAFVQRGLAREGLRDWRGAVSDYDRAVTLWGGKGDGVNPFALSYRGRAKSEIGDFDGALDDFRTAADLFISVDKNVNQYVAARANEAITLYGMGRRDEAVKLAKNLLVRTPGYTDLHVMLAADAWDRGDKEKADYEWNFACDVISTSCRKYKDLDWLTEVRRWPPNLVELQRTFLVNRWKIA